MKRAGVFLILTSMVFFGCKDPVTNRLSDVEQLELDLQKIDNYLMENGITDTLIHPTKIRYTINKTGNGLSPRLSDPIRVSYTGRLLETGVVFDSNSSADLILSQTILGWQIMVQQMREGDQYTIYLPSFFGYADEGSPPTIPPNAVLIFDIELIRVGN